MIVQTRLIGDTVLTPTDLQIFPPDKNRNNLQFYLNIPVNIRKDLDVHDTIVLEFDNPTIDLLIQLLNEHRPYPKQSKYANTFALVQYREAWIRVKVLRDDLEYPHTTLYQLDDGTIITNNETSTTK